LVLFIIVNVIDQIILDEMVFMENSGILFSMVALSAEDQLVQLDILFIN